MSTALTIETFQPGIDSVHEIGATAEQPGVINQLAIAFDADPNDLRGIVGAVAPNKELQQNIAHAEATLSRPEIAEALGYTGLTGVEIAHDLGVRSGLQTEVFRPLMPQTAGDAELPYFDAAVETEAVVNWMNRMAVVAATIAKHHAIERMLLVSSGRVIKQGENPLVPNGTPTHEYMDKILRTQLRFSKAFISEVELIGTDSTAGKDVAATAAQWAADNIDLSTSRLLVPSVAGNWAQRGSQLRTALQAVNPAFDTDPTRRQLWVASDSFPLGVTGKEPKATHQNPYSALGNIVRTAKLLDEQG